MKISYAFIRVFFVLLSILFSLTYTTIFLPGGLNFTNSVIGLMTGLGFSTFLIFADLFFRQANLRTLNLVIIGLFVGYLFGSSITLLFESTLLPYIFPVSNELGMLFKTILYLTCSYLAISLTCKASDAFHLSVPFIHFKGITPAKKGILMDWTILMESRILELASSGLLDESLIVPRFIMKDLYTMLESTDEQTKMKGKRCLEVYKKLEMFPALAMKFSESDFPELSDSALKLIQLARNLDANIITADLNRFQHGAIEGIRIINIQMLSNAIKPLNGEQLNIKIQRYGKEPRQGVGYLDDGTMVVVNGGAEFIGSNIKASVLSVKHTTSGRMIFCNVTDDLGEQALQMDNENVEKSLFV